MNEKHSKASLMLLEMLFVVFFFALVSAVCIQVFTGSKRMGQQSRNLSEGTLVAQNMIEMFTETGGNLEEAARIFSQTPPAQSAPSDNISSLPSSTDIPCFKLTSNSLTLYFDDAWNMLTNPASQADGQTEQTSSDCSDVFPAETATYIATLSVGGGAGGTHLLTGRVSVLDAGGTRICELPLSLFLRGVDR